MDYDQLYLDSCMIPRALCGCCMGKVSMMVDRTDQKSQGTGK